MVFVLVCLRSVPSTTVGHSHGAGQTAVACKTSAETGTVRTSSQQVGQVCLTQPSQQDGAWALKQSTLTSQVVDGVRVVLLWGSGTYTKACQFKRCCRSAQISAGNVIWVLGETYARQEHLPPVAASCATHVILSPHTNLDEVHNEGGCVQHTLVGAVVGQQL